METHDATTTTVWFAAGDRLVAVDVFGLDHAAALDLVDDLELRADGSGFDPAASAGLHRVAEVPARPTDAAAGPATERLVYNDGDLVVSNVKVTPGDGALLAATAGSYGTLERWGDRQVLIDVGLDSGATSRVAFVDPAGVLVTVQGSTGDLRPYVDGLERVDERGWDRYVAAHRREVDPQADPQAETTAGPTTTAVATTVPPTTDGPTTSGG
jgi:hypothetical protein